MSEHKPKTEVWIARDIGRLPIVEREEWVLTTDKPIFHYGDGTVCRNRLDALRILRSDLEDLHDEVSSRMVQVIGEIESAGAAREERGVMEKQTREWVEALADLRLAVARYDAGWRTDGTPDLTPEGMQFREDRFREALAAFLEVDASAGAAREEGGG